MVVVVVVVEVVVVDGGGSNVSVPMLARAMLQLLMRTGAGCDAAKCCAGTLRYKMS